MRSREVCVLMSGGLDSACCAAFFLREGCRVSGMFVDYGQTAAVREAAAADRIASHYRLSLRKLVWDGGSPKSGDMRGRNAFLLMAALLELQEGVQRIAIGIHGGTNYADCGIDFVNDLQAVYDRYEGGSVVISAPFVTWTKKDIWHAAKRLGVPVAETWSCEAADAVVCGACTSCRDREALNAS